jgi:hypothetical protein
VNEGIPNNESGAVIVCSHVAAGYPVLLAERSEPDDPLDTGWQFVCGSALEEDVETAQVWTLNELLAREPSLKAFIEQPPGTQLRRDNRSASWHVVNSESE